jgi:hypothetical protein
MARDRRQHKPMTLHAAYDGLCDVCREPIRKGDAYVYVQYADDVGPAMHQECYGMWKSELDKEEGVI